MNRQRATLIHAGIGLVVLLALLATVYYFWYPQPYFKIALNVKLLYVIGIICIPGAPLLTWVVFKPGKKGLKFDLWVIAVLQVAALAYNGFLLWSQKPHYMVFAVDRFDVLQTGQVDFDTIKESRFLETPARGPLVVVANTPTDPDEYRKFFQESFMEGGPDLQWRSEYWSLYSEDYGVVTSYANGVQHLMDSGSVVENDIASVSASSGLPVSELLYVPAIGREKDYAIIINKHDGTIADAVPLSIWVP